jgi:methyl-accepting chemotaxis protein
MPTAFAERVNQWLHPQRWTLRERVLLPAAGLVLAATGLALGLAVWNQGHPWANLVSMGFFLVGSLAWLKQRVDKAFAALQSLVAALEEAGHRGDLSWRAVSRGDDELGRMGKSFEGLLLRFSELPRHLGVQMAQLNVQVQALKKDHLLQGSILVSQASALTQTQVTSEEIRQTSRQAALQAKGLIEEAAKARDMSRSGGDALGKSLDSLLSVRSRVELLAADVEALESRARRIEGIIDSVKDLADQSNLLALNAAIEAMRAGAQGQGFGLVAREIRALADQSIAATEQVRLVLGDLNDGVRDAAKASREGVHDIQRGLERVQGSAETLADIQVTVSESVGQLQRIAAVVQQQDEGLGQVFVALKDQAERMHEAEAQQLRTAAAVSHLEEAASAVDQVVKGFKI